MLFPKIPHEHWNHHLATCFFKLQIAVCYANKMDLLDLNILNENNHPINCHQLRDALWFCYLDPLLLQPRPQEPQPPKRVFSNRRTTKTRTNYCLAKGTSRGASPKFLSWIPGSIGSNSYFDENITGK